jgi:phosphopantetheinyl transferase (holo-ACP synthase)
LPFGNVPRYCECKCASIILKMPLFYQHNINGDTKLGIWHIEDPETFFLGKVPLKKDVSHPFKRLQHLAGRYLLPFLFPDFPLAEILIADTRKPFLESEKYHFSISHCGPFAAAIVSGTKRVGVDIESITPRIRTLSHKFIDGEEMELLNRAAESPAQSPNGSIDEWLTLIWSAKESIFKWYGLGEMDFRKHMRLQREIRRDENRLTLPFVFDKGKPVRLAVEAKIFEELSLALAWVLT